MRFSQVANQFYRLKENFWQNFVPAEGQLKELAS